MSERDGTPVSITLDRKRMYRASDSDQVAVEVGPGKVIVPAWVASAWGIKAAPVETSQTAQETAEAEPTPKTAPVPRGRPPKTAGKGA